HNTDESKTGKKRKKKTKRPVDGEPIRRLTWWEEWEEGEEFRLVHAGFGSDVPRVDRLIKASQDFADGRKWPPIITGVRTFWDQYRLYLGLLSQSPVFRKAPTSGQDQPDADISDDEDEHMQPMKKIPQVDADAIPEDEDGVAEIEELAEERLLVFLNDPEKSTRIFLTDYMREHGLIWAERHLIIAPRLLSFFFNYLLRNRILPESSHERGLRAALEVTALALKELPLTSKMGQMLPDTLSMGLRDVFGRMANETFLPNTQGILSGWDKCEDTEETEEEGGPRKKAKVDGDGEPEIKEGESAEEKNPVEEDFEAELKAANAKIIRTDDLDADALKQIVEDNIGMDVDVEVNPGDTIIDSGWGTAPTWGDTDEANSGWAPAAGGDVSNTAWDEDAGAEAAWADAWAPPVHSHLMSVLGPTALPLTHKTGIVEKSTRRIKAIHLPPPIAPSASSSQAAECEDSGAVEEELERRFARVVLEPWVGDRPEAGAPIIRTTSQGDVYPGSQLEGGGIVEGDIPPPEKKVHDPLKSEITLLVELSMVDIMGVGMGVLATWIQLVKQEGKDGGAGGKKKKKSKSSKVPKGYWYMEEALMSIPSFYTQEKLAE
ncbi:hypothetical protein HWV62_3669, partial [Athelia sp. TMB]